MFSSQERRSILASKEERSCKLVSPERRISSSSFLLRLLSRLLLIRNILGFVVVEFGGVYCLFRRVAVMASPLRGGVDESIKVFGDVCSGDDASECSHVRQFS